MTTYWFVIGVAVVIFLVALIYYARKDDWL
jgi:hypothetical protein